MADGVVSGIADVAPLMVALGSGSRGPFPLVDADGGTILFEDESHIVVSRISALGVETALTTGTDYTLTTATDDATGLMSASLTLAMTQAVLGASSGSTPAERLVAYRSQPFTQDFTLPYNNRFNSQGFTALLNRLTLKVQELRTLAERAVRLPAGVDGPVLADPLQSKGKILGGDPSTGVIRLLTLADAAASDQVLLHEFEWTATADQSVFTLTGILLTEPAAVLVWVGGSRQPSSTYTLTLDGDDTLLTLGDGVDLGVAVEALVLGVNAVNAAQAATLAGLSDEIEVLAAIAADISTLGAIDDDVSTVAGIAADVSAVAAVAGDIPSVAADAAAAASSAGAASASASAAAASQTAAGGSATTATTQAGNASTSADAAAASAGAAATSETNAATSEANAGASEAAAASSETGAGAAQTAAEEARDAAREAASGVAWTFDNGTADADPGAGKLRFNNATLASVTFVYVDEDDVFGSDVSALIQTWDDSTATTKAYLILRGRDNPAHYAAFSITGSITDAGAYDKIPVSFVSGAGAFTAGDVLTVSVWRVGDTGPSGPGSGDVSGPGTAVDAHFALYDGTTGKLLKDGGISLDTDSAFTANSDTALASQKAVKTALAAKADLASPAFSGNPTVPNQSAGNNSTRAANTAYVDAAVGAIIASADAMVFKGATDCSGNPNYPAADAGHSYRVSVAGKIGGASGTVVEVGDLFMCNTDATASGNQATVGAYWNVIQTNIDGAVTGPGSATDGHVALFNGATGKIIKDSGLGLSGSNTGDQTISATGEITALGSVGALTTTLDKTAITNRSADAAPDATADYALVYDASAAALKKDLLQYVGGVGKEQIWVPAAALKVRASNGCAVLATTETATNKVNIETLDFDASSIEYAQFTLRAPKRYATSTFTAKFEWKHAAAVTNFGVVWGIQAGSFGDNEALDAAFGTAQEVTDTGGTTNNKYTSPATAAVTIANLTAEELVYFQVYRKATDGADTLAIDAGLIGVMLEFTTTQNVDN